MCAAGGADTIQEIGVERQKFLYSRGGGLQPKKNEKTSPKFEICGSVRFFRYFSVFFFRFFVILFRFFFGLKFDKKF